MVASILTAQPRADTVYAYRTVLLRAAPGRQLELNELMTARLAVYDAAGEERPLLLRHSQGDQWDLMVLAPVGTLASYYGEARQARRERAAQAAGLTEAAFERRLRELVSWREEEFVAGPPLTELRARDTGTGFYHIEMFVALAGRYDALVHAREMENAYLVGIGHQPDAIFTRVAGAGCDVFTIGFYRNIQQYAEPSTLSAAAQDSIARAAGFQDRAHIGPYLRELIDTHHDTLAGRVHP